MKKNKDQVSQQVTDKNGNNLTIMMSGNVFLKLNSKKIRRIGFIDRPKKTFVVTRKRELHLFRKMNAYGFNQHLISKSKSFDMVLLKDEFGQYLIPVSEILGDGKTYLHFKQQGFEVQLFLPLEAIEKHRTTITNKFIDIA